MPAPSAQSTAMQSPALPVQAPVPAAPVAQGQYSPDGRWWWNGAQWVAVQALAPIASAAPKKGSGARTLYILLFLVSTPVGVVLMNHFFQLSWLEGVMLIVAAWVLWLQVRENVWNWPLQLLSTAVYVGYFRDLFSGINVVSGPHALYALLYILGWYWWLHGGEGGTKLRIRRISLRLALVLGAAAVLGAAVWTIVLALPSVQDPLPLLDAVTTALDVVGIILIGRKLWEGWWVLVVVNAIYTGQFFLQHVPVYGPAYAFFLALSVVGLINWRRRMAAQEPSSEVAVGARVPVQITS